MRMTLLQLQVLNGRSFSYIISANLFALLFHLLLINDVRMTTFTHQLLSRKKSTPDIWQCGCEYSSRSATVSVAVLRLGYAEVVFIQPGGKLDIMWRDVVLGKELPDIKARCGRYKYKWSLQQDGAPSHTTRNTEICSVRTCSSLNQTSVHRYGRLPCIFDKNHTLTR